MASPGEKVAVATMCLVIAAVAGKTIVHEAKSLVQQSCVDEFVTGDVLSGIRCVGGTAISNLGLGKSQGSTASGGGFNLKRQGVISGEAQLTFGEVSMEMNAGAKVVYEGRSGIFGNDMPGVQDSVMYYNCGYNLDRADKISLMIKKCEPKPTTVVALPCVGTGENVAKDSALTNTDRIKEADADRLSKAQRTVDWKISVNKAGTKITKAVINAHSIDFCMAHVDQTFANENQWSNRAIELGQFGDKEFNAYRQTMNDMIVGAALAQADPFTAGIDEDKVKTVIAKSVKGQMADNPQQAAMVEQAYEDGKFEVDIDPPQTRMGAYQTKLDAKIASYNDGSAYKAMGVDVAKASFKQVTTSGVDMSGLLKASGG